MDRTDTADSDWWGFAPDTPKTDATARFRARFGREPAEVRETAGALLVGPVIALDILPALDAEAREPQGTRMDLEPNFCAELRTSIHRSDDEAGTVGEAGPGQAKLPGF